MAIEWNVVIRCKGPSLAFVSLYGSQTAMELRADAIAEGELVEYLGPCLAREVKNFASISDLKDNLKKLRRNDTQDFQQ
jgi:hypothetical protein